MIVVNGKISALDIKETLRYLGYAGVKSTDGIEWLISECVSLILPVLAPKAVYTTFPLSRGEGVELDLGFATASVSITMSSSDGSSKKRGSSLTGTSSPGL